MSSTPKKEYICKTRHDDYASSPCASLSEAWQSFQDEGNAGDFEDVVFYEVKEVKCKLETKVLEVVSVTRA